MMKVWFVILKSGVVSGTIGPSPMTMMECEFFAQTRMIEKQQVIDSGVSLIGDRITAEQIDKLKNLSFVCIEQEDRPEWGDRP